jgi:hypothetical protein
MIRQGKEYYKIRKQKQEKVTTINKESLET